MVDSVNGSDVDPARSALMRRIGRKDTLPEIRVRKAIHARGLRFRLQASELPGRPDVVMRPRRIAIFVHGCFWHRHEGCRHAGTPKTRTEFWRDKFDRNRRRDASAVASLVAAGWTVGVVWECDTKDPARLGRVLDSILGAERRGKAHDEAPATLASGMGGDACSPR